MQAKWMQRAGVLSAWALLTTSLAPGIGCSYVGHEATRDLAYGGATPAPGTAATAAEPRPQPVPADREMGPEHTTEAYDEVTENAFFEVTKEPLSTFSVDVDTASYANVRRMLLAGQAPPKGAVRVEEMVNYFPYPSYRAPQGPHPFAVAAEVTQCPWKPEHRLVRIGIKGREIDAASRPASNLVFLLDVSGSMSSPNKLPLLKRAMGLLVEQLGENDRVAIAVYAGASGVVLPSTTADRKTEILGALDRLQAGGSTNGGAGIQLAYAMAQEGFIPGGTNRVILCTDGDFNVGTTSRSDLVDLVEARAKSGVFLTVLGFGMGNYKDATLEKLADKGNGNYGYIDTIQEARKVLVEEMGATLVTIAKDVKLQVEFNPAQALAYRLIGYENRVLAHEDFNDDRKDAGDIGAGHTVTALYEVVPQGISFEGRSVDPLKYQSGRVMTGDGVRELLTVKVRYKQPDGEKSTLLEVPVEDRDARFADASEDLRFASAVALFGQKLRGSKHIGGASYGLALELASEAVGADEGGYRRELVTLIERARSNEALSQR